MAHADRPVLVIVSGPPATGKTTLANLLAKELRLPCFMRDGLKEILMDTLGAPDRERSHELGRASYALLYDVVDRLLAVQVGAVIESNFNRGTSEQDLQPFIERSRAVLIHCVAAPLDIERRYRERAGQGDRHPGHHDREALPALVENLEAGVYEPMDLAIPLLRVDTSDGYDPAKSEIVAFVRECVAG